MALVAGLAAAATGCGRVAPRPGASAAAPATRDLPWRVLQQRIQVGGPNGALGLVQAQHIFGKAGTAAGAALVRAGLVRVRIPANLARLGEDGWRHDRFEDGWWMERLRDLGVPFKAVVELWPRFTDELHAEHAARLVRRARPDVVIVGNELNAAALRPGVDLGSEIDRYLGQYAAIHAAVRATRPETRIQLYGEAYDGDPSDPDAVLRRVLYELRRRGLPAPDAAGIHVYDHAGVLPTRVAGYRRLLADFGRRVPVSVEELGPRQGIIDHWESGRLRQQAALDPQRYDSRLEELRAAGWLHEEEHADLVVQQLATATAFADQAQVFCAIDFDAEISHRRGLMSSYYDRARPALGAFRFVQRLLNGVEDRHYVERADGLRRLDVVRRDGLGASICWRGAGTAATADGVPLDVPPFTFVCDGLGRLVHEPRQDGHRIALPPPTTEEAGGGVRILV
ncbi:MAG TPA: hypothetical protein VFX49_02100 [Chloroflexota bacterium]|nr:hypothetical protein [Chloroflexota bacterium]